MRLRRAAAALPAAVALTGLAAACGSSNGTTASSSGVPAQLTVWRIFLLVQRRMARGLVAGAVKG